MTDLPDTPAGRAVAAQLDPAWEVLGARPLGPHSVQVLLHGSDGVVHCNATTDAEPPHALTSFTIGDPVPDAWPWSAVVDAPGDGAVRRARDELQRVGLAAVVVDDTGTSFASAGWADVPAHRPIDERTVFAVGSLGKTMTAFAVLQQVAAGHVALDDPVDPLVSDIDVPGPVTVHQLLQHRSGLASEAPIAVDAGERVRTVPECLAAHPLRCDAEPGTAFAYSNWGYAVLGHLVECITGQPFADAARSSLFEPIGMVDTGYVLAHSNADRLATGYMSIGAVFTVPLQTLVPQAAGSVFSTTADLAVYARAVLDRDVPGVPAALVDDAIVLAWATGRPGRTERHAWHTGGWTGFSSMLWLDLDARRATALLANSTQVSGAPGLEEPAIGLTSVD